MRTVPIQVYKDDIPEPKEAWQFGVWGRNSKSINKQDIWGLAIDGWPTQMYYGFDYANPWLGIKRRREMFAKGPREDVEDNKHHMWLRWYFDVGRKLYVTLDDLEQALRDLGIEENYEET